MRDEIMKKYIAEGIRALERMEDASRQGRRSSRWWSLFRMVGGIFRCLSLG